MKESEILDAILSQARFSSFIQFRQFRMELGSANPGTRGASDKERTIDLFMMNPHPSKKLHRIAIEVKVTIGDFNRELREPIKRRAALRFSNEFYFAAPEGIIPTSKLPAECGLIEIHESDAFPDILYVKQIIEAPWHDNAPSWPFVASIARRVSRIGVDK